VATPADVRAAYLRKAKASHPDAGGTKQEFQNIQAAYERLGTQRRHQAAVDARYYARRPNDIIDRINLCGNQPVPRVLPSSRRRVDGVEDDAAIQDEHSINLISTQVSTTASRGRWATSCRRATRSPSASGR